MILHVSPCLSQAQLKWGKAWETHYLPAATIKNAARACQMAILHSVLAEDNACAKHFAEKISEHHYAAIKSSFSGNPSIRDGVLGTQKKHLENLRSPLPQHPGASAKQERLCAQKATEICTAALKLSCCFQAYISWDKLPQELFLDLESWWKTSGQAFFSSQTCFEDEEEDIWVSLGVDLKGLVLSIVCNDLKIP